MANLTEQQKYLLARLPRSYDLNYKDGPDPVAVVRANKVISDHVDKTRIKKDEWDKKVSGSLEEAREAIYFKNPVDALKVIQKMEQDLGITPRKR
jgi:hypothetical protein